MSLICQGFMKFSDFLWPLQPLKKAAILSLYCTDQFPIITIHLLYSITLCLASCQRLDSAMVERSAPDPATRVRDPLGAKSEMELCQKNADFFY